MKIDPETLTVLSTLEIQGRRVVIPGQLERRSYLKVDEVLRACGGRWTRGERAHVFPQDAAPLLDAVMVRGEVTTSKDLGFFPTPVAIARELAGIAGVERGTRWLEPSAGTGRLVDALLEHGAHVTAIERDRAMRDRLAFQRPGVDVWAHDDFLDVPLTADLRFAGVLANPPFLKVGRGDHIDHVQHAFAMLRPGGVLVAVMPSSIDWRQDKRHTAFRSWFVNLGGEVSPLPEFSFRESGTDVRTCVLRIRAGAR